MAAISSSIMSRYENAEIIRPPETLRPIYVSKDQSDTTLKGLAITYAMGLTWGEDPTGLKRYGNRCQLFEVPLIGDDCQEYCGRGYSSSQDIRSRNWSSEGWDRLADKTDFTCRKYFAKVFVYYDCANYCGRHFAMQWVDGTTLHKLGITRYGATEVVRTIDADDPGIVLTYGPVEEVWIQELKKEAPHPFSRFEGTYWRGPCPRADDRNPLRLEEEAFIRRELDIPYEHYQASLEKTYQDLLEERDRLRMAAVLVEIKEKVPAKRWARRIINFCFRSECE